MTTSTDESGNSRESSSSIGERLRTAREQAGLTEAQVAETLHLNQSFVSDLEAGEFESLGAPIFVKGHLRNLAQLLRLDVDAILAAYDASHNAEPPALSVSRAGGISMDEKAGRGSRWAWVILVAIVVGLGFWLYPSRHHNQTPTSQSHQQSVLVVPGAQADNANAAIGATNTSTPTLTPAPASAPAETQATPLPTNASTSANEPQDFEAIKQAALAQSRAQHVDESHSNATGTSAPANAADDQQAESVTTQSTESDTPPTATADNDTAAQSSFVTEHTPSTENNQPVVQHAPAIGASITLVMAGDCWVEINDANGLQVYRGLVRAGQQLNLKGQAPLHMFLGDAPQATLTVEGASIATDVYTRSNHTARFVVHTPDDAPAYATAS